jgi:lycopene beta-cyclase
VRPDTDIAIVGGGCAGLSLAVALGLSGAQERVRVLEPRTTYGRDRTWCFWNTQSHPFMDAISHSWGSWRVSAEGRDVVRSGSCYRYCHIAGDSFYDAAVEKIDAFWRQELCNGVSVHSIEPHVSGHLAVETSVGRMLARQVFDSRPPTMMREPMLLQRFVGWHVRTSAACFDPATVDLMRFLPGDIPGRVRFVYVLPFAVDEALVEMTYLDEPQLAAPDAGADLRAWLQGNVDGPYEVGYREHGCLPMGAALQGASTLGGRLHSIGIRGGRLKPSSGYGFMRMQRHSSAIARALKVGRPIPQRAEPRIYEALDAVFLRALRVRRAAPSDLFLRMFAGSDPDSLVRFLSEDSGLIEMMRVAWSLPKKVMLSAALAVGSSATPAPSVAEMRP